VPPPWVPPPASDSTIDESIWQTAPEAEGPAVGEIVLEPGEAESFLVEVAPSETPAGEATPDFAAGWAAIRDANIRPYVEWVVPPPFTLPVATAARGVRQSLRRAARTRAGRAETIRAAVAGGTGIPGTDATAIRVTGGRPARTASAGRVQPRGRLGHLY